MASAAAERLARLLLKIEIVRNELTRALQLWDPIGNGGQLQITWKIYRSADKERLNWQWQEMLARTMSVNGTHRGFGRDLIERGLPYELDGTAVWEMTAQGVHCVIDMPLDSRVASHWGESNRSLLS